MPHQCLKCGYIFEEGSSQLLKGCPGCGGNRFFFTKQPLNETERDIMSKEIGQDLTTRIMELAIEKNKNVAKGTETWIRLKPKDLRKMIEDQIEQEKPEKEMNLSEPISDDQRTAIIEKIKEEADHSDTPETIEVEQPGKYHIDLKGLLEKEPIVIEKDGTYTIHLPSLFKMHEEKKK
ncbi:Zn-ribbon containing protein [uncultured archaeon]|nr:Zn-ribbon containing protein [uncultured archaeon]